MTYPETIYYLRHAENEANLTGVFSHRAIDLDLTERGWLQARQVAEFLAGEPLGEGPIFASPLRRAIQTATAIGERLGRPVTVIEDFREINVGDLEGRSGPEAVESWWAVLEAWTAGQHETRFAGGENQLELTQRLQRGFDKILASSVKGPHVLVAHAGVLRAGFKNLATPVPPTRLSIPNCSVSRLEIDRSANAYSFAYWARCDFLAKDAAGEEPSERV